MAGLSAFKSVAKTTASKKKVDRPEICDPALDEAVANWLEAKKAEVSAESAKKLAEAEFLDPAVAKILEASNETGEPQSSVSINGKIMISIQERYGKIAIENLPRLCEIFGEEEGQSYFHEKMEITLTEAALADESIMNKLAKAVGDENIEKYFEVKRYMTPRPNFHHDRLTKKSITAKARRAMDEGILTTPKGAVKAL